MRFADSQFTSFRNNFGMPYLAISTVCWTLDVGNYAVGHKPHFLPKSAYPKINLVRNI